MKKKIELLSPAGSFDALKAAVNYGADAIYLGGTSFSARAFANNFNHEEIIEAVKYCHLRDVKVYVTLNTLLTEKELENALKEARFYYEINVDALIIQDLGLFYRLKQELPNFPLHASTQMHIHNISGVKNAKKLGFKKAVLARESDLDLIKEACKEDIEIECFVHGAICVSYSGQCLMSSVTKNRSANKGMCAQCCRLKYKLLSKDNETEIQTDTDYLLSPKDMFLLEDIPSLIEAGVSSLKIEGRLKSPSYVGFVTSIYRKAIDAYYEGKKFNLSKDEYNNLLSVFNRGFTNSYLHNSDTSIFNNIRPNHIGRKIGKVVSYSNNKCFVKLEDKINQFDGIRILNKNEDVGKILNIISLNGKYVSSANKGDIIEINIDSKVNKDDSVVLTLDHNLECSIEKYPVKRIDVSISFEAFENKPVIVSAKLEKLKFKKVFDMCPQEAKNAPLTVENVKDKFSKIGDEPFNIWYSEVNLGNIFMPISQLNEIRRLFIEEFKECILKSFKRDDIPRLQLENKFEEDENGGILIKNDSLYFENEIYQINSVVNNTEYYNEKTCFEFGNILSTERERIAYYTLNVCNSYAYEFLKKIGFNRIVLSTELNNSSIKDLIESFNLRNGTNIKPYVLKYGRRSLMYLRRNPFIKYVDDVSKYILFDGTNRYILEENNNTLLIKEEIPFISDFNDENNLNFLYIIDNEDDLKTVKNSLK